MWYIREIGNLVEVVSGGEEEKKLRRETGRSVQLAGTWFYFWADMIVNRSMVHNSAGTGSNS